MTGTILHLRSDEATFTTGAVVALDGGQTAHRATPSRRFMKAAVASRSGPAADVLRIVDLREPEPGRGEVRVRIATSGVNPSDVKRRGAEPPGSPLEFPQIIPHSDGAGTIEAVGDGVSAGRIGERVWLYNAQWKRPFGTAAQYCALPSMFAVPLPDRVDFATAASFGIPALTAYHAIHLDGPVHGMSLLVQGGAAAVGFYAIQFAKAAGATVITTVSSAEKAAYARRAGADHVVDYRTEDLAQRVATLTNGRGVDRIVEVDLAANAMSYPKLLRDHGKAVVYGSGASTAVVPSSFIRASTTLEFFIVYELSRDDRATAISAIDAMIRAGSLDHGDRRHFPLDEIAQAHETVEGGGIGNVVIDVLGGGEEE